VPGLAGPALAGPIAALVVPILVVTALGAAGVATRRRVVYAYGDLAPHVRRIVEREAQFAAGDRLILYSDGLIEALDDDGEPFGFARFEKLLEKHGGAGSAEIRRALFEAVASFTRNRPSEDDQTLVVVSFEDAEAEALRAS